MFNRPNLDKNIRSTSRRWRSFGDDPNVDREMKRQDFSGHITMRPHISIFTPHEIFISDKAYRCHLRELPLELLSPKRKLVVALISERRL
uniref:Uncharacterized protein n=1 Tax=Hyaloperonospora arabidopsidis (strain Emoy2) TaxID=559515 RepID=M4BC32_HYAAE